MPANVKSGSLTSAAAAASGEYFTVRGPQGSLPPVPVSYSFVISANSAFVGTVRLERSTDGGTTWEPLTNESGTVRSWTAAVNTILTEIERSVKIRPKCTAYTSGTIAWRLAQ